MYIKPALFIDEITCVLRHLNNKMFNFASLSISLLILQSFFHVRVVIRATVAIRILDTLFDGFPYLVIPLVYLSTLLKLKKNIKNRSFYVGQKGQ